MQCRTKEKLRECSNDAKTSGGHRFVVHERCAAAGAEGKVPGASQDSNDSHVNSAREPSSRYETLVGLNSQAGPLFGRPPTAPPSRPPYPIAAAGNWPHLDAVEADDRASAAAAAAGGRSKVSISCRPPVETVPTQGPAV